MPIYEYRCPACGRTVEQLILPGEDEPEFFCDECGTKMGKIPSRFGFRFKDPPGTCEKVCKPKLIDDDEAPDFDDSLTN